MAFDVFKMCEHTAEAEPLVNGKRAVERYEYLFKLDSKLVLQTFIQSFTRYASIGYKVADDITSRSTKYIRKEGWEAETRALEIFVNAVLLLVDVVDDILATQISTLSGASYFHA